MTTFAAGVSSMGVHWAWTTLALLAVLALVALNGFFVAAEALPGAALGAAGAWTGPVSSMVLLLLDCRGAGTNVSIRATRPRGR
jgi:hypothetical protein